MSDTFKVTASLDKTSYNKGDPMKLTISGGATRTVTNTGTITGSIGIQAADGATETIAMPAATVTVTTSQPETVKLTSIADPDRTWTVAADGQSATSIA